MPILWHQELLPEVDSTNRRAETRILDHWKINQPAEGLVIRAARQTAGQGQHGRTWASPPGGLYLSAVIEKVPADWRPRLALVAGLAVINALESLGTPPDNLQIRWPNDILLHDKKLAGILCQALAQGPRFAAIIGIGINITTPLKTLPPEVRAIATSLEAHNIHTSLHAVTETLLHTLAALFHEAPPLPAIVARVQSFDALRGKPLRFKDGENIYDALGAGIQSDGSLLLQLSEGTLRPFAQGSILPDRI